MNDGSKSEPLANKLRPLDFKEVAGQPHLTDKDGLFTRLLQANSIGSMVFWGPPGSGKTTIARILANNIGYDFIQLSAIFAGVADLKKIFAAARQKKCEGRTTLLFIDEIHRFNRAQQDSLLPVIEDGTIVCIGATTQNPSFELNSALLSRMRIVIFRAHDIESLRMLLHRAERLEEKSLPLDQVARELLLKLADGDARVLLSFAEEIWRVAKEEEILDANKLQKLVQKKAVIYDKNQDGHYNLISALHKSVRGSDPDAALYYFSRMVDAGEDMMFLARRFVRMAVEDIGLADPQALLIANAAKDAYHFLGSPEGELALANACVYLSTAPKSNAVYKAYNKAMRDAVSRGSLMPPKYILNAPTKLMKSENYGVGYIYDGDEPHGFSGQEYFPIELGHQIYYHPVERGFEREIAKRLTWWNKLRETLKRT
ncbi:MAG: replication-associated recombination protein A [Alphaproteobacteria bacterium]|nr:replication-associated recombination protein A [Alphaproteobacteria bacterium]